jgi:hypothetical protein
MRPVAIAALVVVMIVCGGATTAHADDAARGEALKQEGIAAAQAKNWDLARAKFEESYAAFPNPILLFNLATAQEQTNRLIAARKTYVEFLEKSLPGENDKFRARAKTAIKSLDQSIPTVQIDLKGFTASVVVELDGRALPAGELSKPITLDPGEHVVVATRGTELLARREIMVSRGSRTKTELVAPPPKVTEPPKSVETPVPVTPPPKKPESEGGVLSSPLFWTITGIVVLGGAGAGYYYFIREPPVAEPTRGSLGVFEL